MKNDLAAVAILSGAVSIPPALYTHKVMSLHAQEDAHTEGKERTREFSLVWLSILVQT